MIFPIGDTQVRGGTFPLFTYLFIFLNVAIFSYQLTLASSGGLEQFMRDWATVPNQVLEGRNWITVLSSMFLHGGWMHLIGNMLFLWVFADNIEALVGNVAFVLFYLLGGVVAWAAHFYFNSESSIPAVGASGAISAVLGAYLIMFPGSRIRVLFFFFVFHVSAFVFLGLWIAQQFMSGIASLRVATQIEAGGVAWWAHIGGFVFGVLAGLYFRSRGHTRKRSQHPTHGEHYDGRPVA